MRTRLTMNYSIFLKGLLTFFIFLFSFVFAASTGFTSKLGNLTPVFELLLIIASFFLVQFITKDRTVIEFDEDYLYIVNKTVENEEKFPLEHVSWLNLRPGIMKGNRWFVRFSLHYLDADGQPQRIKLWIDWLGNPLKSFVKLVKQKNPAFVYKDATWTFDYKD